MGKGLRDRIEKVKWERRSVLYRWLYDNHDELAPALTRPGAPWAATAATFEQSTIGYEVSRQAVRQTWSRVMADKAKAPVRARTQFLSPAKPTDPPLATLIEEEDDEFFDLSGKPIR